MKLSHSNFPTVGLSRRDHGFTLFEMLVATAVLSLVVVIVAQITNSAATLVHSVRRMDADTESRLIFNRMSIDFGHMLKRSDIDYSSFKQPAAMLPAIYNSSGTLSPSNLQPGNDQCAFYSETDGYFSGASAPSGQAKAPVALIAYMVATDPVTNTPTLRRMGKGLGWETSSPAGAWQSVTYLPALMTSLWTNLFTTDPDYKTLGDDVFRLEYLYQLKTSPSAASRLSTTPWDTASPVSHKSPNGFADVSAIVVTLALLDNTSRKMVTSYTGLQAALSDAVDAQSTAATWNAAVNSASFATTAGVPRQAASQIRIYERYFYLNTLGESAP